MESTAAREMTLAEIVNDLPPGHQARREFVALHADIKRLQTIIDDTEESLGQTIS